MKNKQLNIISFDVPFPPDYGGVIDIYYKIKALRQLGIDIHLHCFTYGRKESHELNELCKSVSYYERNVSKSGLFNKLPYIVVSRSSTELIRNLLKNNHPVLFEGLHTCKYLSEEFLKGRRKVVRTHNIEHEYYENLALVEKNIFKRYYFLNEAEKLRSFEDQLKHADRIIAISRNDAAYFSRKFDQTSYIPAFHPNEKVNIGTGKGDYVLYHGNLSIGENNQAARFLVNDVFSKSDKQLIVAGSKPSAALVREASRYNNIRILRDIPTEEILSLIKNAHINVLPTFQPTGIKLKLLFALFNGRFCIANGAMVDNTGLESQCHICETPDQILTKCDELFSKDFTESDKRSREICLEDNFSNRRNAEALSDLFFS